MKNIRYNIGTALYAALLLPLLALVVILSGCTGAQITAVVSADALTNGAEIGASYAIQNKLATVAQLQTLATDLPGVASGTALSPADNAILAGYVAHLVNAKVDLTVVSVIDAINGDVAKVNAGASPTLIQGAEWSQLKDIVAGINAAIAVAQANPSLVP